MSLVASIKNFNKNEIQNVKIHNLASAPGTPVSGQIYFDTSLGQFGVYNGSSWAYLVAGAGNVSKSANASAGSVLQVSGGADKTIADFTSAGGVIKVSAAGVVSLGVPGTDFTTATSSESFTNKTYNAAAGTGNSLTNIATSMFAANVIDTDVALTANSDTRIASQKATKAYADALLQGIKWKEPVRAATTATGTLASAYANASVIDGVTLATGDRILIKDQAAGAENGIYTVNASGAPTRATDADSATEVANMVVDVREGTANADQAFVMTNNGAIVLGSTALVFVDFVKASVPAASTTTAGKVTLATSAEAEAKTDSAKALTAASVVNFPVKKIFTIGDGSTTAIVVTHNLNTKDITASVRDASTDAFIDVDITATSVNTATITFAVAPASNTYKVVIIG